MPRLSCFTGFGFLTFSGAPSECEKVYNALRAGYRNPKDGSPTFDTTPGTYQEAKIFAWANAIAAARVTMMRAGNELRPETSYELLQSHEAKFGMTPGPNDSVAQRRAALAIKQKSNRGPRYEYMWEGLSNIFGANLVNYRPITPAEAVAYPPEPKYVGNFKRPDAIATTIRLTSAVTRTCRSVAICEEYSESNIDTSMQLTAAAYNAAAQSFTGDGRILARVSISLKRTGAATGPVTLSIATASGVGPNLTPGVTLATSKTTFDASTLTTVATMYNFDFYLDEQIPLTLGANYCFVVSASPPVGSVEIGTDTSAPAAPGNTSVRTLGVWSPDGTQDLCYHVYTGFEARATYENWNKSLVEARVTKGDLLVVDQGNLGIADKVLVTDAGGSGSTRWLKGYFRRPHGAGAHGTTGPAPIWTNSKRHVLVVVKAAAAVDPTMVTKAHAFLNSVMRSPTTWAIVQEASPGSGTVGPFTIGETLGSPLGATPVELITL